MGRLPELTAKQLIRLLKKDGFTYIRNSKHGAFLSKDKGNEYRQATIPNKGKKKLVRNTLEAILSQKQTGIGTKRLLDLIDKHGLS